MEDHPLGVGSMKADGQPAEDRREGGLESLPCLPLVLGDPVRLLNANRDGDLIVPWMAQDLEYLTFCNVLDGCPI